MPFLIYYWKWFAIGAAILVFSAIIGLQRHEINSLKSDKEKITSAYLVLASKTQEQNQAIQKLGDAKKEADANRAKSLQKAKVIERTASDTKTRLNAIVYVTEASCDNREKLIAKLLDEARK